MAAGPEIGGDGEVERLRRELATALAERNEARAQQAATAEVLAVINASPGNLAPVFDAMLGKAMPLCEAAFGIFVRYDGRLVHPMAFRGLDEATVSAVGQPFEPPATTGLGRALKTGRMQSVADLRDTDGYRAGLASVIALADGAGARSVVWVPLRKDKVALGVLVLYRREVRPFSDKHVALMQAFAAQAVIAMENARLLNEQREALEQQTATADILRVISQSPTDVKPVLEAVVKAAVRFCGAEDSVIFLRDGDT
jgi:GAF domain-containing protein